MTEGSKLISMLVIELQLKTVSWKPVVSLKNSILL